MSSVSAPGRNVALDHLRGVAAVLVVAGHSRFTLQQLAGRGGEPHGVYAVLLAPTGLAVEAVAVFFVLSGYLVGGQVLRQQERDAFSWRVFLTIRGTRLWTVLLPGLAVTAALDALTRSNFPAAWAGYRRGPDGLGTAVCNAVFLQRAHCEPYGSNESLWSLSFEFWFYVVFAAAAAAVFAARRRRVVPAVVGAVVAVGGVALFGLQLLPYSVAWLLGVAIAVLQQRRPAARERGRVPTVASAVLLVVGLAVSQVVAPPEWATITIVGLCSTPLVWLLAHHDSVAPSPATLRLASVGVVSFSMYVFHLPVIKLVEAAFFPGVRVSSADGVVVVYGLTVLAATLSGLAWWLFERHTRRLRDAVLRRVAPARDRVAAAPDQPVPAAGPARPTGG